MEEPDFESLIEERRKRKDVVKDISKIHRGPKNMIEKLGIECERLVIEEVTKGTSINDIVQILKTKYPDINWFPKTITNFLEKNVKLKNLAMSLNKDYAMQQAELNLDAQNKLSDYLTDGEEVLHTAKQYNELGVYFAGLKSLAQILYLREKLAGRIKDRTPPSVQVNVIQAISEGKSEIFNKIVEAKFKVPDNEIIIDVEHKRKYDLDKRDEPVV